MQTVYKGRKKKTIEYYAIKSVEKSQKTKVLQEVCLASFDMHFQVLNGFVFMSCGEFRRKLIGLRLTNAEGLLCILLNLYCTSIKFLSSLHHYSYIHFDCLFSNRCGPCTHLTTTMFSSSMPGNSISITNSGSRFSSMQTLSWACCCVCYIKE